MADDLPYRTSFHRPDDPGIVPAWERLLTESPQATACSDLGFAARVGAALELPVQIAAVWEDDELRAGVILFEKRKGPYRAAALPPLVQYITPLLDAPLRETDVHHRRSALDALLVAVGEAFDQAQLVLHPSLGDARVLLWNGWDVTPAYTYHVDLSTETITSGWSSTPKHTWKKERDAFEVREGAAWAPEAVSLIEASLGRQGESLDVEPETFCALTQALAEDGLVRAFVARRNGEPEAGLLVLSHGRTAHYWLAGSAPGPAMTVLVGEVMAQLRDDGFAYFDLVGANVPSIAEFKRKFGSTLVPYFRARHIARPELRLLDRLRR